MSNILEDIVACKREEIVRSQQRRSAEALEELLPQAPPTRDFAAALAGAADMGLIAEIKKASPSAGLIRPDFDPVAIAHAYEAAGAHCLSCLTDEKYFQGRLEYLTAVRNSVDIPVLRKDFMLDRYQVLEARVAGADCILLIAECLDDCRMRDLYFYAAELGMQSLIEIYDPENLDRVLALQPDLLGINNRDLRRFETDLGHTLRLAEKVPPECLLISESGIRTRDDVLRLRQGGVRGILVGESLMREADIGAAVRKLLGT